MPEFDAQFFKDLTAEIEAKKAAGTWTPPLGAAAPAAPATPPVAPGPAKAEPKDLKEFLSLPGAQKAAVDPKLVEKLRNEWHDGVRRGRSGVLRHGGGEPSVGNAGSRVETATQRFHGEHARRDATVRAVTDHETTLRNAQVR